MLALLALLVFCLAGAFDFAQACYLDAYRKRRPFLAPSWAVVLGAVGASMGMLVYTYNRLLIIPELAGFFAGTYLAVRLNGKPNN